VTNAFNRHSTLREREVGDHRHTFEALVARERDRDEIALGHKVLGADLTDRWRDGGERIVVLAFSVGC
jgi:hypothetical protein